MADSNGRLLYTQSNVEDIANAIRAITGDSKLMLVSDMASNLRKSYGTNKMLFYRSCVSNLKKRLNLTGIPAGANHYIVFQFANGNYIVGIQPVPSKFVIALGENVIQYGKVDMKECYIRLGNTGSEREASLYMPNNVGTHSLHSDGVQFPFITSKYDWVPSHYNNDNLYCGQTNAKYTRWCNDPNVTTMMYDFDESHPVIHNIFKDGAFHFLGDEFEKVTIKDLISQKWYNLPMQPIGFDIIKTGTWTRAVNVLYSPVDRFTIDSDDNNKISRIRNYGTTTGMADIGSVSNKIFDVNTYTESLPNIYDASIANLQKNLLYHSYDISSDIPANCASNDIGLPEDLSKFSDSMMEETSFVPSEGHTDYTFKPRVEGNYLIITLVQSDNADEKTFSIEFDKDPIFSKTYKTAANSLVDISFARFIGDESARLHYDENVIPDANTNVRTTFIRLGNVNKIEELYSKTLTNSSTEFTLLKEKVLSVCVASCIGNSKPYPEITINPTVHESYDLSDISYVVSRTNWHDSQFKVFITENAENSKLKVSALGNYSVSSVLLFNILG